MKQAKRIKRWRYYLRRFAYQIKILRVLQSISREKYDEKVSASLVYGFLSAVAVNFFFQPGHVYSSGATGLAQIISALSNHWFGFYIPISLTFYAINFPLMILAWYQIGHKFTIFTFIHEFPLYPACASCDFNRGSHHQCSFWGCCHGFGDWFCAP